MRILKFYGASDDLFEIEGTVVGEPDEVGCYNTSCPILIRSESEGDMIVIGWYSPHHTGTWMIGLSQINEDTPLRDWPMKWGYGGYCVELTIQVPDDAVVSEFSP